MRPNNSFLERMITGIVSLVAMVAQSSFAVSVGDVGRAMSLNFQSYLQDEIDYSQTKAYVVTDTQIQRWPMNG